MKTQEKQSTLKRGQDRTSSYAYQRVEADRWPRWGYNGEPYIGTSGAPGSTCTVAAPLHSLTSTPLQSV